MISSAFGVVAGAGGESPGHGLTMVAMYVNNMSLCEDFSTTHGQFKGKALPLVVQIKVGDDSKMQGKQQIDGYLAAKMWIPVYVVAACLPNLAARTFPALMSAIQLQHNDPS
ncbi:hypothetical protein ACP70R_021095 [Stipagrostis hirtigluma subsp. patula]